MKKTFSLSSIELSEAAVKDAENFGLSASLEGEGGETKVCFESQADYVIDCPVEAVKAIYSEYEYQMKWMREDVSDMRRILHQHKSDGHLPPILDAGSMKKALKALGLGDSYKVELPSVYIQY